MRALLAPVVVVAGMIAAAGCTRQNPAFCDDETVFCDNGACDLATNTCPSGCSEDSECDSSIQPICGEAGVCRGCQDSAECSAKDPSAGVCDTTSGECVSCASDSECPDSAPVCDEATGACGACSSSDDCAGRGSSLFCDEGGFCRGCVDHGECAGEVCLSDGSCPAAEDIIHVQAGALGSPPCGVGADTPCGELRGAILTMETVSQRVVLVEPGEYTARFAVDGSGPIGTAPVFIRARAGASYAPLALGGLPHRLHVLGGAEVTIDGLEIRGAVADEVGVLCSGGATVRLRSLPALENHQIGAQADQCALLELSRSLVRGNRDHALLIAGSEFDVSNNIITGNGDPAFFTSVVDIAAPSAGVRRFSFNTVAMNSTGNNPSVVGGVMCNGADLVLDSNVIYGNAAGGSALEDQIGGSCTHVYSAIQGIGETDGNTPADPLLDGVSLRLMSGSPCIDAADPSATALIDIDGDDRPVGPQRDIGADEFRP